jgi:AcrR family transcriptional regulator
MSVTVEALSVSTRLRPGPNGLPREQVAELQRRRMITAMVEVLRDHGYARMTVGKVIGRAGVSRKTFYEVFCDREDCFLASFEHVVSRARVLASDSYACQPDWRDGIRAALAELLGFMDEEPALARLCVVDALAGGERIVERRALLLDELARSIDQGRAMKGAGQGPPELTGEAVVGGIFAVLHTRLLEGGEEPFADLLGPLTSMIVLPYLGPAAARRELNRPCRRTPLRTPPVSCAADEDSLNGLKIRLTYRTVRVLTVIGERPGASNREVAEGSGIVDQGQISKLLHRLARLDLIENLGGGQPNGAANAWRLTRRGAQLEKAAMPR